MEDNRTGHTERRSFAYVTFHAAASCRCRMGSESRSQRFWQASRFRRMLRSRCGSVFDRIGGMFRVHGEVGRSPGAVALRDAEP